MTTLTPEQRREWMALGAGLALFLLVGLCIDTRARDSDIRVYFKYTLHILEGQVPYRDFAFEYPPLALIPFFIPRSFMGGQQLNFSLYRIGFLIVSALWSLLIAAFLARISRLLGFSSRERIVTILYYSAAIGLAAPYAPWRYDLFPTFLTVLALWAVLTNRPAWAGICLAAGTAAKLYPIVLVPIVASLYVARRNTDSLKRFFAGGAAILLASVFPFYGLSLDQCLSFLRYHAARGLQVESLPAGLLMIGHSLKMTTLAVHYNYGAVHLAASPATELVLKVLPYAFLLFFSVHVILCYRGFRSENAQADNEVLARQMLVALMIFMAFNKVFSPQYLVWIMPFIALTRGLPQILFLPVIALSTYLFPYHYRTLTHFEPMGIALLNARNFLFVLILLRYHGYSIRRHPSPIGV